MADSPQPADKPHGTKLRSNKQVPVGRLQKQLWGLCREIIFKKYGNTCYTCRAPNLEGSNRQLGHFIPSSVGGAGLRYELQQLRPQCFRCNISFSGNWPAYLERMTKELGKPAVEALLKRRAAYTKCDRLFYEAKIAQYQKLI